MEEVDDVRAIDLIEDCLMISYNIRKTSVKSRSRSRSRERHIRRLGDLNLEEVRGVIQKEDEEAIKALAEADKRNSQKISLAASSYRHAARLFSQGNDDDSDEDIRANAVANLIESESKDSANSLYSSAVNSLKGEDTTDDAEALEIFEKFRDGLEYWFERHEEARKDPEARAEYCDMLTEKYLTADLSVLLHSRVVTSVRRVVARIIEEFEEYGALSPLLNEPNFPQSKPVVDELEQADDVNDMEYRRKQIMKKNAEQLLFEKIEMKEKYEQLMAIRNLAVINSRSESDKEAQICRHVESVRKLISSEG